MASIQLKPPLSLDFAKPNEWSQWRRCFEQYRHASGLSSEDNVRQVSALLFCLGQEADKTEEDHKKYNSVIHKLNDYFKVRRNVIFKYTYFNRCNKHNGETVEQYIAELNRLVETCENGRPSSQSHCSWQFSTRHC